jgi:hypothetical protein
MQFGFRDKVAPNYQWDDKYSNPGCDDQACDVRKIVTAHDFFES